MIGIDIIKVSRIDSLLEKKRFFDKFFTDEEQRYIYSKNNNRKTIAGLIATKEAVSKAFGVGLSKSLGLLDIEVLHDINNAPFINTRNGNIQKLMMLHDINNIQISITHDGEYIVSVCYLNKNVAKKLINDSSKDFKMPKADKCANKHDLGRVLIIGGSKGMAGSVMLSSEAALRTGAGLVYLLVPECINQIVQIKAKEQIILTLNDDGEKEFGNFDRKDLLNVINNMSVVAIGPGLRRGENAKKILDTVLSNFDGPIVLDADAIDIVGRNEELMQRNIYLTPHVMEFSKLSKYTLNEINYDKVNVVNNFLDKYDVNLLLKGRNSLVANRENIYINDTGNEGMATAGSGDVLTGIVAALLARENSFKMFKTACYIHGLAGDIAARKYGKPSLIASDIIEYLPEAIGEIDDN